MSSFNNNNNNNLTVDENNNNNNNTNVFLDVIRNNYTDCDDWNLTSYVVNDFGAKLKKNCSSVSNDYVVDDDDNDDDVTIKLNKFQIIKAVVLAGVIVVIMISVCRMVFQLFVRYNVRQDR